MKDTTSKAERAVIYLGDIPLEVFMLPSGEYRLSQTQSTEAVGEQEIRFRNFLSSKSPETLSLKDFKPEKLSVEGSNGRVNILPIAVTVTYWKYEARKGNSKARKLLEEIGKNPVPPFEGYGGTYIVYSKSQDKLLPVRRPRTPKHLEASYVERLHRQLGGEREVGTKAGYIDLLTSSELIEVKHVKSWKAAIGQVEVYGDYYSSHQKRIHLFGSCHQSLLDVIQEHCSKRQILLTWES
jgi:hypothetical protein